MITRQVHWLAHVRVCKVVRGFPTLPQNQTENFDPFPSSYRTMTSVRRAHTRRRGPDTGVYSAHSGTQARQYTASSWPRPLDTYSTGHSLHSDRGTSPGYHLGTRVADPPLPWLSGTRWYICPRGTPSVSQAGPSDTRMCTPFCSGSRTWSRVCSVCWGYRESRPSGRYSSGGQCSKACRCSYRLASSNRLQGSKISQMFCINSL